MLALPIAAIAQTIQWTRQFGTTSSDEAAAVAADASGVYVAGCSQGLLPGQTGGGRFVRKYDANGTQLWTRQFGPRYWVSCRFKVAVHETGVYVAGSTDVGLPGQSSIGDSDVFVRKYDTNGNEMWTRQFGTASLDEPRGVAVNATGVYVVGRTRGTLPDQTSAGKEDAYVRKYDLNGNELWTRQFGTESDDWALGVAVEATGVYVVGRTLGTLPGQTRTGRYAEAFVRKYDGSGAELWTRQFGSTLEVSVMEATDASGVAVDATGVYVVGDTTGALPGQSSSSGSYSADVFVRKYDSSGTELWTRQSGSRASNVGYGAAADATGVYVVGFTRGALPGQTQAGAEDAFVRKYDGSGAEQWTVQFGATRSGLHTRAQGVAVDATGVYVVGYTDGALPGQTRDAYFTFDAFLMKLAPGITSVSAASFTPLLPLAPESIAAGFGAGLASATESATAAPLQTTLAGTSVKVRDSQGTERLAPLFFVSPGQINYLIPEGTALGDATITVVSRGQTMAAGKASVVAVSPGLFSANNDGRGAPAAIAVRYGADNTQTWDYAFQCGSTAGSCVPKPIDLGLDSDRVYLQLFGTGIRGVSPASAVSATVGGVDTEVLYTGPQGGFAGLDQVNILLPRYLRGRGEVDVILTAEGRSANAVKVSIK